MQPRCWRGGQRTAEQIDVGSLLPPCGSGDQFRAAKMVSILPTEPSLGIVPSPFLSLHGVLGCEMVLMESRPMCHYNGAVCIQKSNRLVSLFGVARSSVL